jgi:hypothetical protein
MRNENFIELNLILNNLLVNILLNKLKLNNYFKSKNLSKFNIIKITRIVCSKSYK